MPKVHLTNAYIQSIKPPLQRSAVIYFDRQVRSFGLKVTQNGIKSWIAIYRIHGRQRKYKIGNTHAASAMADVVFREGPTGGGKIIREAALRTDPYITVGKPGVIKKETLDAHSRLAKNPATLGRVYNQRDDITAQTS